VATLQPYCAVTAGRSSELPVSAELVLGIPVLARPLGGELIAEARVGGMNQYRPAVWAESRRFLIL
jgi:hypothetical protein